ncbi:DEAD/DEAH box helicase family protein [Sporosarcina jeotgali]|uniref:DEAD/DEAH box helicase family protein n=1 Tax=Sporosarcina jeotgali TaxID=3020056 RepID=A0ABZ0KX92_9BACL|nr:DEAD/DEAH box helicase family protein [Sporosarcina sp. B2O-1]WOV84773.1 DEAD/DEAH box helicase family protein [Sporosarcina sp. B2O-1]
MKSSDQNISLCDDCKRLQNENEYLRKLIQHHLPSIALNPEITHVKNDSSALKKVQLFRDLFKGRTDVFAIRRNAKDGKSTYSPATTNDTYIPLSDQAFYDHLSGKRTIGIYPLLPNNTCWFLAADFDKNNWRDDALAFAASCKHAQLPFHIERSRSGDGAHVWIFFSEAIPASLARQLGRILIEQAQSKQKDNAFVSFDRFFPSQDFLKEGGIGNLIALPLQRHPRMNGNSVFTDNTFQPLTDQWEYMSTIPKINKTTVEKAIQRISPSIFAESQLTVLPVIWKNGMHIPLANLSESLHNELKQLASFSNPAFYKARANRLSTHNIPTQIECSLQNSTHLILPRGCEQELIRLTTSRNITLEFEENRNTGNPIDVDFKGTLATQQQDAIHALMSKDSGVLAAATGFGKTVTAAALIAERKVNTLIIVNRTQLLKQWMEQLAIFLDVPRTSIGQFGSGKKTTTGIIDVATIQSLTTKGAIQSVVTQYGQVVVDECHHLSALSFERVMQAIRAKHVVGLTATPKRKDGLHPIITMQCGPILYQTDAKSQSQIRPYHHILMERPTNYQTTAETIQQIYTELVEDNTRNQLIFEDVLAALEEGRTPLILTERVNHVNILGQLFKGFVKNVITLSGGLKKKEREAALNRISHLHNDEEVLIIATGKYIGEGFDFPRLDTLLLVMPISGKGILTQYVGRLHRNHSGKHEVRVYDYIDRKVPSLATMAEKRQKGFRELGYKTLEENRAEAEQMKLF